MRNAEPVNECVPVPATDPLSQMRTSGTTGKPKGVGHDNGGYAVALTWSMRYVYGVEPGDVYWAASDLPGLSDTATSFYGPLLYGCTTILYEGKPVGTPDAGAFWRVISATRREGALHRAHGVQGDQARRSARNIHQTM